MSEVREFLVGLSDQDVIDVRLEIDRGEVTGFAVNYRACIEGSWYQVVRYDTAHGYLHKHVHWRLRDSLVPLEDPDEPNPLYGDELDRAYEDIQENWRRYRSRMEDALQGTR